MSHWIATVSIGTLAYTGVVILMSHPRLYWGEAGNELTPALIELPISRNYHHGAPDVPYNKFNENGWGRSLHFLAAWALVVPGLLYVLMGVRSGHFRKHFLGGGHYRELQRRTYAVVVFLGAPLIVFTGLTMSPAITAVFPILLTVFGGYQSARTIHFAVFVALMLFVIGHVALVIRSGFLRQMRAMTVGGAG